MTYELWDLDSGNLIGSYETEHEALEVLRNAIDAYGKAYADAVGLGRRDDKGQVQSIAESTALAERALARAKA